MSIKNIEWKMTLDDGKQYGASLEFESYEDDDFVYRHIKLISDQMKRTYDELKEEQ